MWRYHKPVGLMTTHSDPQGRPTVFEKLPQPMPRVISVGRLDLNSEGLLLLTNDGELARALEMPSTAWVRQYRARALGHTTQAELDRLKNGTTVDGVIYGPMEATLDKRQDKADGRANVWLTVSITEGKNREVRKVLESIGLKVNRLIRLAYGPFLLGNLEAGDVEEVGPRVIRELLSDKIDPRNLPPEGASQTRDLPKARPAAEGRRAGGDRFGKTDAREGSRPARERKVGDGPRVRREFEDRREFKDRDFDERPRFEGDGESRDRRPERAFAPRGERSFDKKPWTPRPETGSEDRAPRAARAFKPREDREAGDRKPYAKPFRPREDRAPRDGARPARSYGTKSHDDIPAGEAGAYERAKREFGGAKSERPQSDRPRRDFGERKPYGKPRFDRPQGERPQGERNFRPREDREGGDRKPYGKPRFDRPQGERPQGERSFRPREDREGNDRKPYGKPRFDRPQGERPQGERSFRPREDREGGGERKSYGGKPRFDRPQGERPSFRPREDRDNGGARKSYGDRPSSGPRPGGKPGGRPGGAPRGAPGGFSRKPRRED
nr:pseudouridine synthase [Asticcacaulis solisilvae]